MSLRKVVIRYLLWEVSLDSIAVQLNECWLIPEFTVLKQKWQQTKGQTWDNSNGKEILPGFTGTYF